ncbi:MAG: Na+-transporting methylmalonyl-CoA/oxaloacetate decarboxylase beta subunit [Congregibacter sp.]|jgi:Na+-transporting methylmalonyl-CoA/oxaloacetate decarboxylase beta subunit
MDRVAQLWAASGLAQMDIGSAVMLGIALLLLYLAIHRRF